jgi:hypothetical protein
VRRRRFGSAAERLVVTNVVSASSTRNSTTTSSLRCTTEPPVPARAASRRLERPPSSTWCRVFRRWSARSARAAAIASSGGNSRSINQAAGAAGWNPAAGRWPPCSARPGTCSTQSDRLGRDLTRARLGQQASARAENATLQPSRSATQVRGGSCGLRSHACRDSTEALGLGDKGARSPPHGRCTGASRETVQPPRGRPLGDRSGRPWQSPKRLSSGIWPCGQLAAAVFSAPASVGFSDTG